MSDFWGFDLNLGGYGIFEVQEETTEGSVCISQYRDDSFSFQYVIVWMLLCHSSVSLRVSVLWMAILPCFNFYV